MDGAVPFIIALLFCGCCGVVLWAADKQAREHRRKHDPIMHDLRELELIERGEIAARDAHFEVREAGRFGRLIDDPDARELARLEDAIVTKPPKHENYP